MPRTNSVNLNFYSLFLKTDFTVSKVTNYNTDVIFAELFERVDDPSVPLLEEHDRNRITGFRNGKYTTREELNKKEKDFLDSLENYLLTPSGNVDHGHFQVLFERLRKGLEEFITQTDSSLSSNWSEHVDRSLYDGRKKLLELISEHPALEHEIRKVFEKNSEDKKGNRFEKDSPKKALLWLVVFSLFPQIRENVPHSKQEKKSGWNTALSNTAITVTRLYQALVARDDMFNLFSDTLTDGLYTSEAIENRLSDETGGRICKSTVDELISEYYSKGRALRLPELLTLKERHGKPNQVRVLYVRCMMMRAFELYSKGDSISCRDAQDRCRMMLDLYGDDEVSDPVHYDLLKILLLRALSCWRLKDPAEEEKQLKLLRSKLMKHKEFPSEYRLLAHFMFKRFGGLANTALDLDRAVSSYSAAFMFAAPDDHINISTVRNNLAIVYRKFMKLDSACYAYEQSYELKKNSFPEDSEVTARHKTNYSNPLRLGKLYDKALELITPAFEVRSRLYEEDPSNDSRMRSLNYTILRYALIYICQAEDKLCSDGVGADLRELLARAEDRLKALPEHLLRPERSSVNRLSYINRIIVKGKIEYLRSFSDPGFSDDSLFDFDKARVMLADPGISDKTQRSLYGLCGFACAKVRLFRTGRDLGSTLEDVCDNVLEGWNSIRTVYESIHDRSSYGYYQAAACFHFGALIDLLSDRGEQELLDRCLEEVRLSFRQELTAAEAAKKLLSDALDMLRECQQPDLSLPEESLGIRWHEINYNAFHGLEMIVQRFAELCGSGSAGKEKAELFMKYPLDFYLA